MASLFILPGLLVAATSSAASPTRTASAPGLLIMVPIFLIGAWILASASLYVKSDINRVWTSTAAQAEVRAQAPARAS